MKASLSGLEWWSNYYGREFASREKEIKKLEQLNLLQFLPEKCTELEELKTKAEAHLQQLRDQEGELCNKQQ
jgi:hypothetical protein